MPVCPGQNYSSLGKKFGRLPVFAQPEPVAGRVRRVRSRKSRPTKKPGPNGPVFVWARRDSNPHASRHMILNHARLPVPTLAQIVLIATNQSTTLTDNGQKISIISPISQERCGVYSVSTVVWADCRLPSLSLPPGAFLGGLTKKHDTPNPSGIKAESVSTKL